MAARFTFWFECASRYTYPAVMRFEVEAQKRSVDAVWRPFLLGPIFNRQGWETSPFVLYPVKGRYAVRDLERICAALGLPFKSAPDARPQNSLLAARVAGILPESDRPAFVRALMLMEFGEGRDIGEAAVVREALRLAGLDDVLAARASDEDAKAILRVATDQAMALGIFGAPSFVTSDGELFWGNDRLEMALDWEKRLMEARP
jgi:2-hydroxychromene-2-carboxylate isomerase